MPDLITLHRFNGDEVYRIAAATIDVRRSIDEDDPALTRHVYHLYLEVIADPASVQPARDPDDPVGHPHVRATLVLQPSDLPMLLKNTFRIPMGATEDNDFLASL